VSLAWAPAMTPRKLRFVDVGNGTAEDFAKAGDAAGAVVLVHSETMKTWDDLFAEYLRTPAIIQNALAAKAAAIAFLSTREHDLLYRHITSFDGRIAPLPMLLVAREDGLRLARLMAQGPVEAEIAIPNRIGGATPSANVVAVLEGSEHPEEWVLLGAHLDSWELGTGALDNGCNAALVVDVLRALRSAGVKPRRSIRFVLFSGEEEGTLGSHAYAVRHRRELDNAVAAVILDEGTGQITGWSLGGREDVVPEFNRLAEPLAAFHAAQPTTDAFYGTDNFDFLLEGVPTLVANQVEANYLENYHASSDTFDKVDLGELRRHVAITAALVYELADAPERLGPRQSRAEIEELLQRTHLDEQMKTFGYWEDWKKGTLGREMPKPRRRVITDQPE
jgi:carboxypeptidase Q